MWKKILAGVFVFLILIAAAIYFIDPLEKMREARDDQRVKDLESLKKAIDFHIDRNAKEIAASSPLLCADCPDGEEVFSYRSVTVNDIQTTERGSRIVNSTGWVPLDLSLNAKVNETPLRLLPVDPLEKGYPVRQRLSFLEFDESFVYIYTAGRETKYKLSAKMESLKGLQKAVADGGSLEDRYEVGSDLGLLP